MMFQVIDNFLSDLEFKVLKEIICSDTFPLFFRNYIVDKTEEQSVKNLNFTHSIYRDNMPTSQFYDIVNSSLLSKLDIKCLIRSKINCYPRTDTIVEHSWHIDFPYQHQGVLLYLNTCDGETRFEHHGSVKSIENRVVIFDPSQPHASTSCTDQKCRWNIIVNYF